MTEFRFNKNPRLRALQIRMLDQGKLPPAARRVYAAENGERQARLSDIESLRKSGAALASNGRFAGAVTKLFGGVDASIIGERQIRVIASAQEADRAGDIVVQEGIDLTAYRSNPVILWQHDPTQPIGRASAVAVMGGTLQAVIEFAPPGISSKADEICALYKAGILSAISIGFDPLEADPIDPRYPRGPQRYTKSELLEISCVAVPAQPSALTIERAFGGGGARLNVQQNQPPRFGDFPSAAHYQKALRDFHVAQTSKAWAAAYGSDAAPLSREQRMADIARLRNAP